MSTQGFPGWGMMLAWVCLALFTPPAGARADTAEQHVASPIETAPDLWEMGFEDLFEVEVTTVSKKEETLHDTPAAVYVITQSDIQRSGATTIAEALRLVPGLSVGRVDANIWAVTSRGFNDIVANKLLVLIDGRVVYNPVFAGTYWEEQDLLLEDIERIEVVRGPGGTLWGANAVNGIISIITKSAKDTQGGLVSIAAGTEEKALLGLRYGGRLGERAYYRVYGKYAARDEAALPSGENAHDNWEIERGGLRVDWDVSQDDALMFQGELFQRHRGATWVMPLPYLPYSRTTDTILDGTSGSLLVRWKHRLSEESEFQLGCYYDGADREIVGLEERRDTADLDFQHQLRLSNRHRLIWGGGLRHTKDEVKDSFMASLDPASRSDRLYSAFVQDEIDLIEDRLRLTLGSKFEHNDYTGFEWQPSLRLAWIPNETNTLWASVTRAVRTPSRADHDARMNVVKFPGGLVSLLADASMDSEELVAYELGYRAVLTDRLGVDVATFYNDYDDLRTTVVDWPRPELMPLPPHVLIPVSDGNDMKGHTYGAEVSVDWRPMSWWRLRAMYAFLEIDLGLKGGVLDPISIEAEGNDPEQRAQLWSSFDLARNVALDAILRYEDRLPSLGIDDYLNLDLRVAWRPTTDLEVALVGQNLLDDRHAEFSSPFLTVVPTQVQRGVYGKLTWRF